MQLKAKIKQAGYRRGAGVIAAVTIIVAGFLLIFGIQAIHRIQAVENHWAVYSKDAAEADRLLHNASRQMGYGGFIHNFKNYILRRDSVALKELTQNRMALELNLQALQEHVISTEEKAALEDIRVTFTKYDNGVDHARIAFERGLSSAETDILVRVDDKPALAALAFLMRSFDDRIEFARVETEKALQAAASMVLLLLIVVPVVILLGVMLVLFLRRIVDGNAKLQEVRDELGTLLRQAPDAILHVAQDGSILRVNDQALTLFGYPRDDFLKLSIEDLVPDQFKGAHPAIRDQAFKGMKPRPIGDGTGLTGVTKDGREVPVEISLSFTVSGGKRIATAIVRDVTERKHAEEALQNAHDALEQRVSERTSELQQRTHELEAEMAERKHAEIQLMQSAKMATIGEMSSGITHELNQPMNIMRMGVEAAQIRIQRGQADIGQLSETLENVEAQIVRMSDIITHMRTYSRLDTEGQTTFDPVNAARDDCKLFAAQLQGDDIQIDIHMPESASNVLGHVNRLEQVILNLLSNARDAIQSHQEQTSSLSKGRISVTLSEDAQNKTIMISVEDNGGGVPKDVLPHIFAPFVTTKESGRGTGLGLSISFGIVQGMNGTIHATNGEHGARFQIQFPVADEAHIIDAQAKDESEAEAIVVAADLPRGREGGVAKVLVVDDEIGAAHSLSDFLQEIGYLVYTAYNGEEALQLYDSDPTDVVITDLRMPVMGGEELVKNLRDRTSDLPIFIMTGHGTGYGGEIAPESITEVWVKPLSLSEVAQRLHDMNGVAEGAGLRRPASLKVR